MATITFTLSSADQTRLVNTICGLYDYQTTINGSPNPETKANFALRIIKEQWKSLIKEYEKITSQATSGQTFESAFVEPNIT